MTYRPEPIDTSRTQLPFELERLAEELARNVHDLWARRRIDDGWKYGQVRDDVAKTHPNLIPYSDLTESDRQYDREMVIETLRVILALGFRVSKS